MGPSEIAELGRVFEIGGHTRDHLPLIEIASDLAADQISANKHRLENLLGREVCGFAYVRGQHNRVVRGLVEKAGYRYARTVKNLMSTPEFDLFRLPDDHAVLSPLNCDLHSELPESRTDSRPGGDPYCGALQAPPRHALPASCRGLCSTRRLFSFVGTLLGN